MTNSRDESELALDRGGITNPKMRALALELVGSRHGDMKVLHRYLSMA